ncbi:MAG TPA: PrgI family protein [Gallicola sp.]|nr:PrgI family protein [Gallicola sp.]
MAFVPVPKDLSRVKTKVALNLTKRQLICFSLGGILSIPVYLGTREVLGNELSLMILILIALPFFFLGIFERDGIPLEKYAKYVIRQKFKYPKIRVYKTQNMYKVLGTTEGKVKYDVKPTAKKATKEVRTK